MRELSYKTCAVPVLAVKAAAVAGDGRYIVGVASTFDGPVDAHGDIIAPGAYTDSLRVRPSVPVLWSHDASRPLGRTTLLVQDDAVGLVFKARLSETRDADDMLQLVGDGVVGMSIGYNAARSHRGRWRGEEVRFLDAIDLYEVSPTAFASNVATSVSTVSKSVVLEAVERAEAVERERKALLEDIRRFGEELPEWAVEAERERERRRSELLSEMRRFGL